MNLFENLQMMKESDEISYQEWIDFNNWIKHADGVLDSHDNFTNDHNEFWIKCINTDTVMQKIEQKYPNIYNAIKSTDDEYIFIDTDDINITETFENLQIMKEAENWESEYQKYADSNKYDSNQLGQIRDGLEDGLDVSIYADPKYDGAQMNEILTGLEDGLDVSKYADSKYDDDQMHEIRLGLEKGVDVSIYADPKYDDDQMEEIRKGLQNNVDVSIYADPKYNREQMHEIRLGLEKGLDATKDDLGVTEDDQLQELLDAARSEANDIDYSNADEDIDMCRNELDAMADHANDPYVDAVIEEIIAHHDFSEDYVWDHRDEIADILASKAKDTLENFDWIFSGYIERDEYELENLETIKESDEIKTYNVSFKRNGVYQANLIKGYSEEQVTNYFKKYKPDAEILGVDLATRDDERPGKPVIDATVKTESNKFDKYVTFKHINDVWAAFEDCTTINDVKELIDLIPSRFGSFSYKILDSETVRITNDYYDHSLDQYDTDEVDIDIDTSKDIIKEADSITDDPAWEDTFDDVVIFTADYTFNLRKYTIDITETDEGINSYINGKYYGTEQKENIQDDHDLEYLAFKTAVTTYMNYRFHDKQMSPEGKIIKDKKRY